MPDSLLVLFKLTSMFLVMALGWAARRRGLVGEAGVRDLSRLLVDLIFPALVFTQMLATVSPAGLRAGWLAPVLGALVIVIAKGVGRAGMPLFRRGADAATAVFLVAMPNWIFFPLPIAEALFGADGVREVLLCNVGAQLMLWTVGVWTLQGRRTRGAALRALLENYGLLATAAGLALALSVPAARSLGTAPAAGPPARQAAAAAVQALGMIGSLTVPLSLLITGAQLGGLALARAGSRVELGGVLVLRLLAAPLATIALLAVPGWLGSPLPAVSRLCAALIAAMPVAISCSVVADRFGGDVALAARAIFHSTLWSLLTVPALYALAVRLGS